MYTLKTIDICVMLMYMLYKHFIHTSTTYMTCQYIVTIHNVFYLHYVLLHYLIIITNVYSIPYIYIKVHLLALQPAND